MNIGENIKMLRKRKSITQESLADFLGVSFQAVSKWERNDEPFPDNRTPFRVLYSLFLKFAR